MFLGDGGYQYSAQQLGLGAEGAKTTNKYGENEWLRAQKCVAEKVLWLLANFHLSTSPIEVEALSQVKT